MYEGALRVPFLMRWKGQLPAGEVYDKRTSALDLFATAGTLGKGKLPEGIDGINLMPYLKGLDKGDPHDVLYWRQSHKTALRDGDWKLVNMTRVKPGMNREKWELYNIANDLGETKDLSKENPEVLKRMVNKWRDMNSEMCEPIFR